MLSKYRRKIRKKMGEKGKRSFKFSMPNIIRIFFILSLAAFLLTQLLTNAILSPLGHELQSLNYEKNLLIEDNRMLEQEIARDTSLTIIKVYSEDQFKVSSKNNVNSIFVTDLSIQALR